MGIENLLATGIQPPKIITPYELEAGMGLINNNKLLGQQRQQEMQIEGERAKRLKDAEDLKNVIAQGEYIANRVSNSRPETWKETVADIESKVGKPVPNLHFEWDEGRIKDIVNQGMSNLEKIKNEFQSISTTAGMGTFNKGTGEYKIFKDPETGKPIMAPNADNSMDERKFNYQQQLDAQKLELEGKKANAAQEWKQRNFEQRDRAIEATAINKPMTEAQGKANIFGTRAAEAHKNLMDIEKNISTTGLAAKQGAENIPLLGGIAGAVGNTMLNESQQKVDQSQRDFVNAVLRNESGAAISQSEFDNARKQYFPQPGDSDAVIEQKRKNRETEINGLMSAASGKRTGQTSSPTVSFDDPPPEGWTAEDEAAYQRAIGGR